MLQNPNQKPTAATPPNDPTDGRGYIAAEKKERKREREKEPTEDELSVMLKLDLSSVLLSTLCTRLLREQLRIKDARRLCLALAFMNSAARELGAATEATELDSLQNVFWE